MEHQLVHSFEEIISLENFLVAWQEFILGKRRKNDVQGFSLGLMDNIIQLHDELANGAYQHGGYEKFHIADPKPRLIHKASVRDRLVHHAVYRQLYPLFDRTFVADSYSCRNHKGTHKAMQRFRSFAWSVSRNNTKTCWVLQCDIRQFFASIDHNVLLEILQRRISDERINSLLREIIQSFSLAPSKGLPLGNLTSQLFVNVYMNEFDQFVKHGLREKLYVRYADDFVILSQDKNHLAKLIPVIRDYLGHQLQLSLHPNKVQIQSLTSGIDFLGWVNFPTHRVLRTATRRGMFRRVRENATSETLQSYLGLLQHGQSFKIQNELLNEYYLWRWEFAAKGKI